jgi:hypothetical protein
MPEGQEGNSAEVFDAPFEWAAKVEYCSAKRSVPHLGQVTAVATPPEFRTSFSNLVPQSSHLYS